ncbi:undecaprenyl-diphosphatase [Alicyclobacillus tolerans]|uniref:Undecaprenyl-diphosphatase n=1 Tax=Alicyclobacillus tolerans TaxID=90970 RepID=A0ABT9LYS2_9BACL|nr:undecaprenyl-diphosphatase [Alicyclobacillus tengchongensis]MDP9729415.1 undecaprenyl-diphosphatase [Alicyclobacillus tengchongensis]
MFHAALLNPFDTVLYHLINGLAGHSVLLDQVMIFFAKDAPEIYALLFLIAWFTLPKPDIQRRHALIMAGLAGILALFINLIISHIWFRPRPFTVFPKGSFNQLIPHSNDASFPSDHASGSFGFAAGSWGHNSRWISRTFTVIAIIVMVARVFVGVHYPTDVIGGMIIGIFSGKVMWKFSRWIFPLSSFIAKIFRFGPKTTAVTKEEKHSSTL